MVGYRVYSITGEGTTLVRSLKSYEGYQMNVFPGVRYVVVAVDITGMESAYSNEVGETVEVPPPPITDENILPDEIFEDPEDVDPFESTEE